METVEITLTIPQELAGRYEDLAQTIKRDIRSLYAEALEDFIREYDADCQLLNDPEFLQEMGDLRAGRLETYSLDEVEKNLGLSD